MSKIKWTAVAERNLTAIRNDDPGAVDQILDAVNLLRSNPRPSTAHAWGPDTLRIRIGFYRILYRVISTTPLVISVETVGRSTTP